MRIGKLILISNSEEERFLNWNVDSNDTETTLESFDTESLTADDFINEIDGSGNDTTLLEFIQSKEPLSIHVEGGKPIKITGRFIDERIETKNYKVVVTLAILVEESELIEIENE